MVFEKKYVIYLGTFFAAMLVISSATAVQHLHGSYAVKVVEKKQQNIIAKIKQSNFSIRDLINIANKIISRLKEKYGNGHLVKLEEKAKEIINSKNLFNKLPGELRTLIREFRQHSTAINGVLDGPQPCQYLLMLIIALIALFLITTPTEFLIIMMICIPILILLIAIINWWINQQE